MPATLRRTRRALLSLGISAVALGVAGCAHTVRVGPDRVLEVALSEYRINPSSPSAPSGVLELIVRNYGRLSHNLVLEGDGFFAGATPAIPPGGERTLYVDLPPGTYTMYSSLLNDQALGLHGTMAVSLN